MASQATWALLPAAPTPSIQVDDNERQATTSLIFLGNGLIRPFTRDEKNDFTNAAGADLVRSAVGQVLGTRSTSPTLIGELPWRPEFGSLLSTLRHRNNDEALFQIAQSFAVEALQRWEPRVRVTGFGVTSRASTPNGPEDTLDIKLEYDIIDRNVPGNNVILSGQKATVELDIGIQ